jgi:hypothetical protein
LEERHCPALRPRTRPPTQRDPTTRVLTVTGLGVDFPHLSRPPASPATAPNAATGKRTRQSVYALTNLAHEQASPQFIGRLARSQWTILDRLHFIRDTAFQEDTSKIRTGRGQENMATLCNQTVNVLRKNGHTNVAAGRRHVSYNPFNRPLDLLGIA